MMTTGRETVTQVDIRAASMRALRERLETLTWIIEGKTGQFIKVYDVWPDPNKEFVMPAATALLTSAHLDYSYLAPFEAEEEIIGEVGNAIFEVGYWTAEVMVDIWTRNPVEMDVIVRAIQDMLAPDMERFGLYIELPDYYNQQGRYTYTGERPVLSEDRVMAAIRRTALTLTVEVPYVRSVTGLPVLEPRINLYVGESVDVKETDPAILQSQGGD